jgi:hypothetical protein
MAHRASVCLSLLLIAPAVGSAAPTKLFYDPVPIPEEDVLTQHDDNQRTGRAQTTELRPGGLGLFGFLFALPVDGDVFAQPLYVSGLDMGQRGGAFPLRNVVFIATMKNNVYAFDAYSSDIDPAGHPVPLWRVNLGPPVPAGTELNDIGRHCGDIRPDGFIGVLSTPVIDRAGGFLYVVAKTYKAGASQPYDFTAFKLDLKSGAILAQTGFPATLSIHEPGIDGVVGFNAMHHLNRAGLLLTHENKLLVAFGGHCDQHPYRGWVFQLGIEGLHKFKLDEAHATAIQNGATGNGIWQAGNGLATAPSVPENLVFYSSANGDADVSGDIGVNLTHSLVRLCIGGIGGKPCARPLPRELVDWRADDWFTPSNRGFLNQWDLDFGSAGPTIISGRTTLYALAGGKEGSLYLTDANNLGHFDSSEHVLQKFQAVRDPGSCGILPHQVTCHIHGAPVWWQPGGGDAIDVFVWGESDHLRGYRLHDGTRHIDERPFAQGAEKVCDDCMPGGILTLSSDHQRPGTGLVWATQPLADGNEHEVSGQLLVYDAATLATLWESGYGFVLGKYTPPTVAHDHVFVATHQNFVYAFGLRTQRICEGTQCGYHNGNFCGFCPGGAKCSDGRCISDPCLGHCGQIGEFDCGKCGSDKVCNSSNKCVCPGAVLARGFDGHPMNERCAGTLTGPSDRGMAGRQRQTPAGEPMKTPPQR